MYISNSCVKVVIYSCDSLTPAGISNAKVTEASQAYINRCKNLKRKLHSCSADLFFNQEYPGQILIAKYVRIKILNTSKICTYCCVCVCV
jgi:hypothetical protein